MRAEIKTNNEPCTLEIVIQNLGPEPKKIFLVVQDADKKFTQYTNRFGIIRGEQSFFVRMPQSPVNAEILIKSEQELRTKQPDPGYKVVRSRRLDLKSKPEAYASANSKVKSFVRFAQEFSEVAGYISANHSIYASDDLVFQITYNDQIENRKGEAVETPARIGRIHGIIECSKDKFKRYTVPMRMCILLHEFSHYNLNQDMADEVEADLNALAIYLGLGYPRIDAMNVFTQVFAKSPTEQNVERINIIEAFINDFDREYRDMTYTPEDKNFVGLVAKAAAGSVLGNELTTKNK